MIAQTSSSASIVGIVVLVAFWLVFGAAMWRIAEKAGYSGSLGLLALIPVVNVVVLLVFAFGTWPIERSAVGREENRAHEVYFWPADKTFVCLADDCEFETKNVEEAKRHQELMSASPVPLREFLLTPDAQRPSPA
jgi:hypothetical protein